MTPRTKRTWVAFVDGPLKGGRSLLAPNEERAILVRYTPSKATPGMRLPHEYAVTSERQKGGVNESPARVARFVRTLPPELEPPQIHPAANGFHPYL